MPDETPFAKYDLPEEEAGTATMEADPFAKYDATPEHFSPRETAKFRLDEVRRRAAAGEPVYPELFQATRAPTLDRAMAVEKATGLADKSDLEVQAEALGTTPAVAARLNTWQGRLENALAKSAVGQTALRVEQGLSDLASTGISLVARAAGDTDLSNSIHKEQQDREQFLQLAERGGDVESLVGPRGNAIYSGVTRSVAKIGTAGLVGPLAVYSAIGGEGYDRGLAEAEQLDLSGADAQSYAGRKAGAEVALTALFGQIGSRFGLKSTEEVLSRGVQNAVSKIGSRIGLADKLKKAIGGTALEAGEEAAIDAVQQTIERAEVAGQQPIDWERMLTAGLTGAAGRAAAGGVNLAKDAAQGAVPLSIRQTAHAIQGSLKKHKKWITDTVKGTTAAMKPDAVAVPADATAKAFAQATGIKGASKAVQEAYTSTLALYQPTETFTADTFTPEPVPVVEHLRVADQEPPPPAYNDTLRWDESGFVAIPIEPSPTTRRLASMASETFSGIGHTLTQRLHKQADKFADPAMKFQAKRMATELDEIGRKVVDSWRGFHGEVDADVSALKKQAGNILFNTSVTEAQAIDNVRTTSSGLRHGAANIVEWVEGTRPTTEIKQKRLRDFVDGTVAYMDKTGGISERQGVRRSVPDHKLPERLAELGAMTDQELADHFRELLPNDTLPTGRTQLIEKLQKYEFFRNPGGNIWVRQALPDMRALMSQQEGHPGWKSFTEAVAEENGVTVEAIQRDFTELKDSHEAEIATEFARRYKYMPSSSWDAGGRRFDWFETHPYRYVDRHATGFAHRLAVLEHVGDRISAKPVKRGDKHVKEAPIDALSNAAVSTGLDKWTVDTYLNTLSGKSANKIGTTDLGGEGQAAVEWYNGMFSAIMAGKMSVSGMTTAAETLATVRAWGGNRRYLQAIATQIGKDPNNLRSEVRRMGLWAKEYADFTLDTNERSLSKLKVYGNLALAATRPVWNVQSEQAALVGYIFSKDFQNGTASEWDRDMLVNHLSYDKAEADAIYNRTAPPEAYTEMARRFAARTIAGRLTSPIEESAIRQKTWFRYVFALTRFTLQRGRELAGYAKMLQQDGIEMAAKRDRASALKILRDTGDLGNYMLGVGAGGIWANVIRSMLYNGVEEGLGLEWEKFNANGWGGRVWYLTEGLISGSLGFLFGNLYWASQNVENGDHPLLAWAKTSAAAGVIGEGLMAVQSMAALGTGEMGTGRYAKLGAKGKLPGAIEIAYTFGETMVPMLRAGGTLGDMVSSYVPVARNIFPLAIGFQRDLELNAAVLAQKRFLDGKNRGPGGGNPGDMTPEEVAYFRNMYSFSRAARAPDSPHKHEAMREYLLAAIGTGAKSDPAQIAESIKGRQFKRAWKGDAALEAEFANKFPHHYRHLLMHDAVNEAWANAVKPK